LEDDDAFIKNADSIGTYLCTRALWAGSRCNWIGRSLEDATAVMNSSLPLVNKALGPELYDGTSGIAYFLGCLYDYTKRESYYRTAEGAINHSLSRIGDIHSLNRFGFYDGYIGIAYIATKLAPKLDNDLLFERAISILRSLSKDTQTKHLMDVVSGNAGAIPALLEMYDTFRDQMLYDLVLNLGDELLQSAVKCPIGWSWDYRANGIEFPDHNLTGFSHGVAGIAYSLLELFRKTDNNKYRLAAEEGFNYENQWFNPKYNNWPDFRPIRQVRKNHSELFYANAWCHGAPGICLSRLRAYQILRDEKYLRDCQAAIYTIVESLKDHDTIDRGNYSLCHGVGGNCEPLINAYEVFKNEYYKSITIDVGRYGIEKYGNGRLQWPCGIQTGETPGLMLGLAGIGHFYLRLHDSRHTPSILML
jgi:lantibiotic modifying enzyme